MRTKSKDKKENKEISYNIASKNIRILNYHKRNGKRNCLLKFKDTYDRSNQWHSVITPEINEDNIPRYRKTFSNEYIFFIVCGKLNNRILCINLTKSKAKLITFDPLTDIKIIKVEQDPDSHYLDGIQLYLRCKCSEGDINISVSMITIEQSNLISVEFSEDENKNTGITSFSNLYDDITAYRILENLEVKYGHPVVATSIDGKTTIPLNLVPVKVSNKQDRANK